MLIGVRHKFLFVANTKAASTSIEAILGNHAEISRPGGSGGKHIPLAKVRAEYRFLFDHPEHPFSSFFRFGVMRDPLEWILSWFRYRKGNKVQSPLPPDMTFADFWEAGDWNIRDRKGAPYLQSTMFLNARGEPLANVIVPYRHLDVMLPQVFAALGVKATVPRLNVSRLAPDEIEIPASLQDAVRDHLATDIALYERLDEINAVGMKRLKARTVAT